MDFVNSVASALETITIYFYPAKPINPGHPFFLKLAPNLEKDKVFTIWRFAHVFTMFWIFTLSTRHCNLFFNSTDVLKTFFHSQNELFKLPHIDPSITNSIFDLRANPNYSVYLELLPRVEFPNNETIEQKNHRVNEAIRNYDFVTGLFRDHELKDIINSETNILYRRHTRLLRRMDVSWDRINASEPTIRSSCRDTVVTANDLVFYNQRVNYIHDLVISADFNNAVEAFHAIINP